MTRGRRWWLAAAAVALLVGVPLAARSRPVVAPEVSAASLLAAIRAGAAHPYTGRVSMVGNLDLPVTSRFTDVAALLGERTTARVWWRSARHWRVDTLLVTGETDLVHDVGLTTRWSYEDAAAVRSVDPDVRLPRDADLIPPALARRVVDGADRSSVTSIAARRVAGVAAPGIRVVPSDERSSIDHVDLWADPATGLALRLDVYAGGDSAPSFSTAFDAFSPHAPELSLTRFVPTAGVRVSFDDVLDIADAANQYAPLEPPATVAGLHRAPTPRGGVGVYGSGLTRLLVIPLRHRDAEPLRDQLRRSAGATETDAGVDLYAGPLGVLVTGDRHGSWLVAGLVTEQTLVDAVADLDSGATLR
ncbi:hypothetical protein ACVW00_002266 [Marmoricola sp. URHA0025 HA25]